MIYLGLLSTFLLPTAQFQSAQFTEKYSKICVKNFLFVIKEDLEFKKVIQKLTTHFIRGCLLY